MLLCFVAWILDKLSTLFHFVTCEFANSRAMRACVSTCLRASTVYVPTCLCARVVYANVPKRANFSFLRANVPMNVPTYYKACQFFTLSCQFLTWRTNMPKTVPTFQTFLLRNAKGNFYTLFLYKKFYIILDIKTEHIKIVL